MNKSLRHRDTAADTRARETRAEAKTVFGFVSMISGNGNNNVSSQFPMAHVKLVPNSDTILSIGQTKRLNACVSYRPSWSDNRRLNLGEERCRLFQ